MLRATLSQEAAGEGGMRGAEAGGAESGGAEGEQPATHIESNTSFQGNQMPEANNLITAERSRSTHRKYDRYDAGRYDNMSDDASSASSMGNLTTARRSRRMQLTDARDYGRGVSDCSHCRKHRMKMRRMRRKSRSRSRRRRR